MVLSEDVKSLFKLVRTTMGAPIRPVQLEDEQLCDLLEIAVGDYAEQVQNWAVEVQWLNYPVPESKRIGVCYDGKDA